MEVEGRIDATPLRAVRHGEGGEDRRRLLRGVRSKQGGSAGEQLLPPVEPEARRPHHELTGACVGSAAGLCVQCW